MDDHNSVEVKIEDSRPDPHYLGLIPICVLIVIIFVRITFVLCKSYGQKTRTPAQRRMYAASRARPSLSQTEPTIYVSPSNMPPPPKYECLAPPSYEEVVSIQYSQSYPGIPGSGHLQVQPIIQPIVDSMSQGDNNVNVVSRIDGVGSPSTVITLSSDVR